MKIPFNGKIIEADPIDFIPQSEPFGVLQLADGKRIKAKAVVTAAFKMRDEKDAQGNSLYFFHHQFVCAIEPSEDKAD